MNFFPIFGWIKTYRRADFNGDLFAGIITAILLVPQGIAYSMLAGLPPQFGLYASILPPFVYAILGTSRTLNVGPVSIASIMIASALASPQISQLGNPLQSAVILSAESGAIMLLMAMCRMGGLVNFISHPVLNGFTSGAALLIIGNQLPVTLGLKLPACGVDLVCYSHYLHATNLPTLTMSLAAFALLLFFDKPLPALLKKMSMAATLATLIGKCGALVAIILMTVVIGNEWHLSNQHIAVVGKVPGGLPHLSIDFIDLTKWKVLFSSASFIALIAYVQSVAIAKVTANLRGEKIDTNQELIALGVANFASAISGGMLATGGFSSTLVNFTAGARTQISMVIAAILLSIAVVFFGDWFGNVPNAVLAVIILVAIIPLVKLQSILRTWRYDQGDGIAEAMTLIGVLVLGIEKGITLGILLTFIRHLRKTSQPHIAVVGRIPNTPHYRNTKNHFIEYLETWDSLLLLRIDESITFANINFIEEFIDAELKAAPKVKHIVLIFTSVSDIDMTALEALEQLNLNLKEAGRSLNLAEVKHFVLVKLEKSDLLTELNGQVFFDAEAAVNALI